MENTSSYPLPYSSDALEPVISKHTIEAHASLADGYKKSFPSLEEGVAAASAKGVLPLRAQLRDVAFSGSGWALHGLYFMNMAPKGSQGEPGEATTRMMIKAFGSVDSGISLLSSAANAVEGPGWALLCYHPSLRKLLILNAEKHQLFTVWGAIPIIALDVWEHAYYLDYKTDRAAYIKNWVTLLNWTDIEQRINFALDGRMPV